MADAKINITAVDQTKAAIESAQRNMASLGEQAVSMGKKIGGIAALIELAYEALAKHKRQIDLLDQLDAMSERTGIAVESLSKLRAAALLSDTDLDTLAVGLKKLSTNMAEAVGGSKAAQAKFEAMGISPQQLAGFKTADEAFAALADKFSGYQDGLRKNALATDVFGKGGQQLIGTLNKGSDGIRQLGNEAEQLGAVFSGGLARQASDFNDNLIRLKLASDGAANSILKDLLPTLTSLSLELIEGRKAFGGWLSFAYEMGFKTSPFDSWSDSAKKAEANVASLKAEIAKLEGTRQTIESNAGGAAFVGPSGSSRSSSRLAAAKAELESESKRKKYFDTLIHDRFKGEADRLEAAFYGKKPDAPTVNKTEKNKAPDHFADNFINQLITEYANLTGAMSKTDEVTRKLDTSTEKFTDSERARALGLAKLIDAQKNKTIVLEHEQKALQSIGDLVQAQEDAYAENLKTMREGATAQQFEITLLGKTAEVVERLRFERELALKVAGAEAQVLEQQTQGLISQIEARQRLAALSRFAGETRDAFGAIQADKRDQQFNPARGMADAAKDYLEEIGKVGDATKRIVTGAFKGMEDALVDFVRTGKLDFKSLADQIISDMVRMQIQQSITKPLASLVQGSGGNLFSGLGSLLGFRAGGGPVSAGMPYIVGENQAELFIPDRPGMILPSVGQAGGGITVNQPITLIANNASAETVGQIRALMPGFIAENARVVEGVVQQAMRKRGGRLAA